MIADTAANAQGKVRRAGTLTPVDTRATNAAINPLGQTWIAGDLLFATTGGGMTNVRPTSGRSTKVAYHLEAAGVNSALLAYPMENPVWITSASGENVTLRMGDSAGATYISIKDYTNTEVGYINSDGYGSFKGMTLGGNLVHNVTNPVDPQDAATKNYVDTRTVTDDDTMYPFLNGTRQYTGEY